MKSRRPEVKWSKKRLWSRIGAWKPYISQKYRHYHNYRRGPEGAFLRFSIFEHKCSASRLCGNPKKKTAYCDCDFAGDQHTQFLKLFLLVRTSTWVRRNQHQIPTSWRHASEVSRVSRSVHCPARLFTIDIPGCHTPSHQPVLDDGDDLSNSPRTSVSVKNLANRGIIRTSDQSAHSQPIAMDRFSSTIRRPHNLCRTSKTKIACS